MKFKHRCAVCAKDELMDEPPQLDALFLCPKCFKDVRKAYKKKHPGQSLRAVDFPEKDKTKIQ